MASMDTLIKEIYFEKQQEGSMLCAQHALNSLLQGEYFTAPDLATIAQRLDQLEEGYDEANTGESSTNMDDTGFFSIQVLEEALKPWSLHLQRWRSEAMRPYQDKPQCQLAFILNSQQHWYTLRRFGEASSDFTVDPGAGHWFNLNSFLPHPTWVGTTYLDMTLQQAEVSGYSVFAVVQDDPTKPLALPRSEADHIAAFVTEDSRPSAAYMPGNTHGPSSSKFAPPGLDEFDDEDAEFQAALQASISDNTYSALPSVNRSHNPPPIRQSSRPSAIPPRAPFRSRYDTGYNVPRHDEDDIEMVEDDDPPVIPPQESRPGFDPIAASRARSQAYMAQVMRQQEAALRESREIEAAQLQAGIQTRRRDPRQVDEEEELRRAIEESRTLHEATNTSTKSGDDEELDVEEVQRSLPTQPLPPFHGKNRVYDDDDAELQAALQASLADIPNGFTLPDPPRPALPQTPAPRPDVSQDISRLSERKEEEQETETESEADTGVAEEQVSVEELRRRRLARFGG